MLITSFSQMLKKPHRTSKIQSTFLGRLTKIPDNSYLVSVDVASLYINILNAEEIKSVKMSLENYSKRTTSTKVITTFSVLIVTLNNFIFNSKNYLQIKSYAMETFSAPSAQTFLWTTSKEKKIQFIKTFSLIYLRFIDDIIFILTGSKTDLKCFL